MADFNLSFGGDTRELDAVLPKIAKKIDELGGKFSKALNLKVDTKEAENQLLTADKKIQEVFDTPRELKVGAVNFAAMTTAVSTLANTFNELSGPFRDYEKGLAEVQAITGTGGEALQQIGEQAKQLAVAFGGDVTTQLDAFKGVLSRLGGGIGSSPEALGSIAESINLLGTAGGISAAESMDALTTSLLQFGMADEKDPAGTARNAQKAIDVLAKSAQVGAAEIPQVAQAITVAGTAAKGANISFEEANAAIQVIAAGAGKFGSEAGTGLRNVIGLLQKNSGEAQKLTASLGVPFEKLGQTLTTKGLSAALDELQVGLNKLGTDAEKNAAIMQIFGTENASVAVALMNGSARTKEWTAALKDSSGAAADQASIIMNTASVRLEQLGAALKVGLIDVFSTIGSSATTALSGIAQIAPTITTLVGLKDLVPAGMFDGLKTTAISAFQSIAASGVFSFATLQTAAASAWAAITGPIGLIVLGVAAVGAALYVLYQNFAPFRTLVDNVFGVIKEVINQTIVTIVNFGQALAPLGSFLLNVFSLPLDVILTLKDVVINVFGALTGALRGLFPEAKTGADFFKVSVDAVRGAFDFLNKQITNVKGTLAGLNNAFTTIKIIIGDFVKALASLDIKKALSSFDNVSGKIAESYDKGFNEATQKADTAAKDIAKKVGDEAAKAKPEFKVEVTFDAKKLAENFNKAKESADQQFKTGVDALKGKQLEIESFQKKIRETSNAEEKKKYQEALKLAQEQKTKLLQSAREQQKEQQKINFLDAQVNQQFDQQKQLNNKLADLQREYNDKQRQEERKIKDDLTLSEQEKSNRLFEINITYERKRLEANVNTQRAIAKLTADNSGAKSAAEALAKFEADTIDKRKAQYEKAAKDDFARLRKEADEKEKLQAELDKRNNETRLKTIEDFISNANALTQGGDIIAKISEKFAIKSDEALKAQQGEIDKLIEQTPAYVNGLKAIENQVGNLQLTPTDAIKSIEKLRSDILQSFQKGTGETQYVALFNNITDNYQKAIANARTTVNKELEDAQNRITDAQINAISDLSDREYKQTLEALRRKRDAILLSDKSTNEERIQAEEDYSNAIREIEQKRLLSSQEISKVLEGVALEASKGFQNAFKGLKIDNTAVEEQLNQTLSNLNTEEEALKKSLQTRQISYAEYTKKLSEIDAKRAEANAKAESERQSLLQKAADATNTVISTSLKAAQDEQQKTFDKTAKSGEIAYGALGIMAAASFGQQIVEGKNAAKAILRTLFDMVERIIPILAVQIAGVNAAAIDNIATLGIAGAVRFAAIMAGLYALLAVARSAAGAETGVIGITKNYKGKVGATDKIPLWVAEGESIINAKSSRRWSHVLETINSGGDPSRHFQSQSSDGKITKALQELKDGFKQLRNDFSHSTTVKIAGKLTADSNAIIANLNYNTRKQMALL